MKVGVVLLDKSLSTAQSRRGLRIPQIAFMSKDEFGCLSEALKATKRGQINGGRQGKVDRRVEREYATAVNLLMITATTWKMPIVPHLSDNKGELKIEASI